MVRHGDKRNQSKAVASLVMLTCTNDDYIMNLCLLYLGPQVLGIWYHEA